MNDLDLKKLIKKDRSVPEAPKNELNQIYQKIESDSFSIIGLLNIRSIALACCLVIVVASVKFSITSLSAPKLTEQEQQELIQYILEDQYFSNGEASYAWVDDTN